MSVACVNSLLVAPARHFDLDARRLQDAKFTLFATQHVKFAQLLRCKYRGYGLVLRGTPMRKISLHVFFAISTLLLSGQFASGQAVYGNIIGTVNDASGAAVPNAV